MRRSERAQPSSSWRRALRHAHHAVFHESRDGRAAEVAAWSNAASALVLGAGAVYLAWSWLGADALWLGAGAAAFAFTLLRVSLVNRVSVWIAAALGTLTVGALGGSLAWVFAHVIETPWAPALAAIVGAIVAAAPPAWSYARLARRRQEDVPDSLIEPVSVPPSH